MTTRFRLALVAALLYSLSLGANPPIDAARPPISTAIEGPSEIRSAELPVNFSIHLRNHTGVPITGTVRFRLADDWRAEPSTPIPFKLSAKGQSRLRFTVRAGAGTHNASYPVHAVAEFQHEGKQHVANSTLIVEARVPNPPVHPQPAVWKPVPLAGDRALGLWRLKARRVAATVVQREPSAPATPAPPGGAAFGIREQVDCGGLRDAIAMKLGAMPLSLPDLWEPKRGGVFGNLAQAPLPQFFDQHISVVWVEFPLSLPAGMPVRLRFATAVAGGEPKAAAVFRARVLPFESDALEQPAVVFEVESDATQWQEAEVDLSRFGGRSITLRLESAVERGFDGFAYWGEPTVITGTPPESFAVAPSDNTASFLLGTVSINGFRHDVRIWSGKRGVLDSTVGFVGPERTLSFQGLHVVVDGDSLEDWRSVSRLLEVREESKDGRYCVRHRFHGQLGSFDVMVALWAEDSALRMRLWLENEPKSLPWRPFYIEDASAGPWNDSIFRVYAGSGNVIERPDPFRLQFEGHFLSTSFVGMDFDHGSSLLQGVDATPDYLDVDPNGRLCTLHTPHAQTLTFIPAASVWEAVHAWRKVNGLKPAHGVADLAGRFVIDSWNFGQTFKEQMQELERSFQYGLTDSIVYRHDWQRWGYDVRLPDLYPPNPNLGTAADLRALAAFCQKNGVLFALHDNYIDFYPDSEGFTYDNVTFNPVGQPVRAWRNEEGVQSYRSRPDRVRPFLERNLRLVREGIAPTAYFVDVWGSFAPSDFFTSAGQFFARSYWRTQVGDLFDWIRDYLGGAPLTSEAGHDQLVGHLDGAQAVHLRVGNPLPGPYHWAVWNIRGGDAERIPWFDAAHHDRFVLQGAGYEERYAAGLDRATHGIYSDDYISTEVLCGRPAMASHNFGRDVVRKYWLLQGLMRALALKTIQSVSFKEGNLHRQHVRWSNGDVWVNRGRENWQVGDHLLPPFGYYAKVDSPGGTVESAIEVRGGRTVEWSRGPHDLFVNTRLASSHRTPEQSESGAKTPQGRMFAFFGHVSTDGAFRLTCDAGGTKLTPLPESGPFTVQLSRPGCSTSFDVVSQTPHRVECQCASIGLASPASPDRVEMPR